MNKVLGLITFVTVAAFAQQSPGPTGSIGFGTTVDTTNNQTGTTYTAVVEFRSFADQDDGPLFFANISSLYNVMGKSGYKKTTFGMSGNADIFIGGRLDSGNESATTIYYGGVLGAHGTVQTNAQVTRQGAYDVGFETGIISLSKGHVFTASPIVVLAGVGAKLENEDGSAPLVERVSDGGHLAGGFKARYLYSDRLWLTTEFIGRPDGGSGKTDNLSYSRVYTTARVRINQKLTVGGEYKTLSFESVDGQPLKIKRLSGNVTVLF